MSGGGLVGCETALWLAQMGKDVTVVEMLDDVLTSGKPVPHMNKIMLLDLMTQAGSHWIHGKQSAFQRIIRRSGKPVQCRRFRSGGKYHGCHLDRQ